MMEYTFPKPSGSLMPQEMPLMVTKGCSTTLLRSNDDRTGNVVLGTLRWLVVSGTCSQARSVGSDHSTTLVISGQPSGRMKPSTRPLKGTFEAGPRVRVRGGLRVRVRVSGEW